MLQKFRNSPPPRTYVGMVYTRATLTAFVPVFRISRFRERNDAVATFGARTYGRYAACFTSRESKRFFVVFFLSYPAAVGGIDPNTFAPTTLHEMNVHPGKRTADFVDESFFSVRSAIDSRTRPSEYCSVPDKYANRVTYGSTAPGQSIYTGVGKAILVVQLR